MMYEDQLAQIAVVTVDMNHAQIHLAVQEVLQLMRIHLSMDVVFVSTLENGKRVIKHVDAFGGNGGIEGLQTDESERSFCEQVLDARRPKVVDEGHKVPDLADLLYAAFPNNARISMPLVLPDGTIYGTLCCFSFALDHALAERDQKRMKMAADMIVRLIAKSIGDEGDRVRLVYD